MILLLYVDDLILTGEEKLILDSKRKLATLEGWIPQTPLGWIQETQAGSCTRVGALTYQLVLRRSEKIEVFRSLLYQMVFINILLSFPFISGASCICD